MKNTTKVKVYYKDTDAEGVVYYGNYLGWLEVGRTELIEGMGVLQEKLRKESGIVFAIREVNVKYLAPALLGDKLLIDTTISEMTGATVVFDQRIFKEADGTGVLEATVTAFAMDLKEMRPVKVPGEFRDRYEKM